jgi:hypothetical protein
MVGDLRIPVPAPVGSKRCEHLKVFVNHLSERAPEALLCLCRSLGLGQIEKVIK